MTLHAWEQFDAAAAVLRANHARLNIGSTGSIWPGSSKLDWRIIASGESARRGRCTDPPFPLPARLALADALFESGDLDGARISTRA